MANQLKMADIAAILALHGHGWSDRRIARELGICRETVGRYVQGSSTPQAKPANAPPGSVGSPPPDDGGFVPASNPKPASAPPGSPVELTGPTDSKPANAPSGSTVFDPEAQTRRELAEVGPTRERGPHSAALAFGEVIARKLDEGLCARRIYQDLQTEHGYAGSYYSVRRLARKLSASYDPPVRRMECAPGTEAQVDFGKGAPLIDAQGRRRGSWVFRIVLSHSRKGYSEAVTQQTTDEFLRCLENAFAHFGGVPRTLVIDNLRAAVARADWFDPELCPKVCSFAGHYGIAILPTRPRTPRHKGKVESGVKYVKNNALKGLKFASLAQQNQHLQEWERAIADTRIHGTTRRQVCALFEEAEKPALLPLPPSRFALFHEALRSVHRDGHVTVKGAHYSLPPEYLGQQVWARWDGRTVRLFDQKMRPIALHAQRPPGTFSTLDAHLHPHKIHPIEKGTAWLLNQTDRIGPAARSWAVSMLACRGIEGVRVLMGLISLGSRHPRPQVERACQVAHTHGAWRLRTLRELIDRQGGPVQQNFDFVQEHPIIRGLEDYGRFVRDALLHSPFTPEERAS